MQGSPPVRPPSMCLIRALRLRAKTGTWYCRAQDGDIDAFGKLVERYQGRLFRTAYMIVRKPATTVEDIVQETLVQAWSESSSASGS